MNPYHDFVGKVLVRAHVVSPVEGLDLVRPADDFTTLPTADEEHFGQFTHLVHLVFLHPPLFERQGLSVKITN